MKKLLAIFLALVITLALSLTCFAEAVTLDKTTGQGTVQGTITATYAPGVANPMVMYAVDVAFGSMSFVYYEDGGWSGTGNTVAVTNHSNAEVNVALDYVAKADYNGIVGDFGADANFTLASGLDTTYETADCKVATLTLDGELSSELTAPTLIGTVVVAISVVR